MLGVGFYQQVLLRDWWYWTRLSRGGVGVIGK
jgi:hypothetical protein